MYLEMLICTDYVPLLICYEFKFVYIYSALELVL